MTAVVVLVFFALALIGMPLAFALGIGGYLGVVMAGVPQSVLPERMMYSINSFPLLAIPCFMLAGELMVEGGIMDKLIGLANSAVGHVRGGLAHVTIGSSMALAAVSGTAVADATALTSTLLPSLSRYYDKGFGAALIASSANLGPIIPPSAAMIVYAFMAGPSVSVGALFMAGVVPGVILSLSMMAMASWVAHRRGFPLTGDRFRLKSFALQFWRSTPVVMMPVLVIGGIVAGMFTATEGAAVAVVYALFVGFFITRRLRLKDLPAALFRAAITTSVVGALIAFASLVTFLLSIDLLPLRLANLLQSLTTDPTMYIILVMFMLLVVGMFLESNAAYIMLVPLLAPIAQNYGIDPIYFGFLFVLNLVIGMLTPPVGVLLFVVSSAAEIPIGDLVRHVGPFIALQYAVLVLCILFPPLVTALPHYLGY